jgi:MoaA/NifB/PqqE/SkfB family radical SAM enzyme
MASKLLSNYLPEFFALGIGRSKPNKVGINLTDRCNQQCIYCEIGKRVLPDASQLLTYDDLVWIIDQMDEHNIRRLSLCGGEPFLFMELFKVVAYAGGKNIRCAITTNGMTVHQLGARELNVLKECKAEINISVDSFRDELQSLTRGADSALSNAVRSIHKLREFNIPVTVLTVVSKYNYQDLFDSFVAAYQQGVRQVLFQPVISWSNYPQRPAVADKSGINVEPENMDVLLAEFKKILAFERKHLINTNVYRLMPWIACYLKQASSANGSWFFHYVLKKFYCRDLYAIIEITYDGGIQPCGLALAEVNIYKDRSSGLLGLWSEATKGIKEDLRRGRYHPYCNGCCHHFSRNMLASIIKYPFANRTALFTMLPLMLSRIWFRMLKKLYL